MNSIHSNLRHFLRRRAVLLLQQIYLNNKIVGNWIVGFRIPFTNKQGCDSSDVLINGNTDPEESLNVFSPNISGLHTSEHCDGRGLGSLPLWSMPLMSKTWSLLSPKPLQNKLNIWKNGSLVRSVHLDLKWRVILDSIIVGRKIHV